MVLSNSKYGNRKNGFGKNRVHLAADVDEFADLEIPVAELTMGMDTSAFEMSMYYDVHALRLEPHEE